MIEIKNDDNHVVLELPSNFEEIDTYILSNSHILFDQIIKSIKFAIDNKLDIIDVFCFKDSNFFISLDDSEFLKNVNHIYDMYLKLEYYELCKEVVDLQKKLKKHIYDNS